MSLASLDLLTCDFYIKNQDAPLIVMHPLACEVESLPCRILFINTALACGFGLINIVLTIDQSSKELYKYVLPVVVDEGFSWQREILLHADYLLCSPFFCIK